MKNLKDAKEIYDHIVVPEELDARLRKTLEQAPKPSKTVNKVVNFRKWTAVAAALLLCFTVGLNTSESFAMEMSKLPIVGTVAKVLTIRAYKSTEGNTTTSVEIPEVEVASEDEEVKNAITDINAKINALVEEYTAQKYAEIEEGKELFLESGETEEAWNERAIDVTVNYEVKYQGETKLSLLIDSWISWFNFEEERKFYNIDLTTGKELTLIDLLGEDAYAYAEGIVLEKMNEMIAEDSEMYTFWGVNDDGMDEFVGVNAQTPFYIKDEETVVISYNKYDVAPGYLGIIEFEIPVP